MRVALLEFLALSSLFGLLTYGVAVRTGAATNVRLAAAKDGISRSTAASGLFVAIAAVGTTVALGSPAVERYRLTGYEGGVICVLVGITLVGLARERYPEFRLLENVTATTVGDSRVGDVVALTGTATCDDDERLETPYENTPCVAYDARRVTNAHSWRVGTTIRIVDDRRTDRQRFLITDDTSRLSIDPTDARLDLPVTAMSVGDESVSMLKRVFSGRSGDENDAAKGYTERCLKPGETVGVLGRVVESGTPGPVQTVDASAVFVSASYGDDVRRTVVRNGALGIGLCGVGLAIMAVTAGIV